MDTDQLKAELNFQLIDWKNPEGREFDAGFDGREYRCRTPTSWKTRKAANKHGLIEAVRIRMEQARNAKDSAEYDRFQAWLNHLVPNED